MTYSYNKSQRDAPISQESSTIHTANGICHTGYADSKAVKHNLYDIYLLLCITVLRLLMMDSKPVRNM